MTSIEERVQAAAQAAAARVQQVRPLDLPATARATPRRRLPLPATWRGWLIPLAAAAAIVAIAASLVAVHQGPNGSGHPSPTTPISPASPQRQPSETVAPACGGPAVTVDPTAPVPSDVPEYFVELCGSGKAGRLVAADTRTGAVLGSVPVPARKDTFTGVYGATDDNRTFLVTGNTPTGTALWVVRLAPGTPHPVSLSLLPWTYTGPLFSIALSPDATKVAVAAAKLQVRSLATGAVLRLMINRLQVDSWHWTDGGDALAYESSPDFLLHDFAAPAASDTPLLTISPNADFAATACGGESDWAISADGTTLICPDNGSNDQPYNGSCPKQARVQLGFVRFAAHSRLPGTAPAGTDYSVTVPNPCANPDTVWLWWACADGTEVIGALKYPGHDEVGVFYGGSYVPLPALGAGPSSSLMIAF